MPVISQIIIRVKILLKIRIMATVRVRASLRYFCVSAASISDLNKSASILLPRCVKHKSFEGLLHFNTLSA